MNRIQTVCLTAAAVVAAACVSFSSPESAAAQSPQWRDEAAALLPPDANGLVGFDLAAARASLVYQRIEAKMQDEQRSKLDEFAAVTGFDPRQDLSGVLAATWGSPGRGKQPFLAVLSGRFELTDEARAMLETFAPNAGEHRGVTIFEMQNKDHDEEPAAYFAILDDDTALIGIHDAVVAGVERSFSGGPSMRDNATLMARSREASAAGQFWFVSDQPRELVEAAPEGVDQRHARVFDILRSMQETTFTADLVSGLNLDWNALFGSAEDAKTLADAARGLLALARISLPPGAGELVTFLDRLQIGSNAERVELGLDLTTVELEQLLDALEARTTPSSETL